MTRNSESSELVGVLTSGTSVRKLSRAQLRLRWAAAILALLNAVALYFYLSPPGGTRQDLELESTRRSAPKSAPPKLRRLSRMA